MTASTIDHIVAVTIFLTAMLLFFSAFTQIIQTATLYQSHRYLASKCSDLLDNTLLNAGYPSDWGKSNSNPTIFGLQDPDLTQYQISPFSLMRLNCTGGQPIYYSKTGQYYSNLTQSFGTLLLPLNKEVDYSRVNELLGINGTYGFQLAVTPIVTLSITEVPLSNPPKLNITARGPSSPLSTTEISYCLLNVTGGMYPAYTIQYDTVTTDQQGYTQLSLTGIDNSKDSYVLIAYAHLLGGASSLLVGTGCYKHVNYDGNRVVPFVSDFEKREITIAHSFDVYGGDSTAINYNATFVLLTEDFTLRQIPVENSTGTINSGGGQPYGKITIPTDNPGILIITYQKSASEYGAVIVPWGIGSMAFSIVFGQTTLNKEWVAADIRQVTVGGIGYQAKLALWSLQGYSAVS